MRFLVHGHVQGVGFRWWVWRQATRLGLRGLARNLRDGSVEVIAAGAESALADLERALAQGPPAGQVGRVERSQVPREVSIPNECDLKYLRGPRVTQVVTVQDRYQALRDG